MWYSSTQEYTSRSKLQEDTILTTCFLNCSLELFYHNTFMILAMESPLIQSKSANQFNLRAPFPRTHLPPLWISFSSLRFLHVCKLVRDLFAVMMSQKVKSSNQRCFLSEIFWRVKVLCISQAESLLLRGKWVHVVLHLSHRPSNSSSHLLPQLLVLHDLLQYIKTDCWTMDLPSSFNRMLRIWKRRELNTSPEKLAQRKIRFK